MQAPKIPPLPAWLEGQLLFERRWIDLEPYGFHLMTAGEGRPVLCLHGNPTWGYLYRRVARFLADEPLRLIMPDLPGLGFSDRPARSSDHTLEGHGAWLGSLVDRLDLEGVILVVQDWGGPIGLRAFADRKERLAGLVVLNTVVGPPRPGFRPTAFHRFARIPLISTVVFRLGGFPQRWLHLAQGDRSTIRGAVARAYRYPLRGVARNVAPLALARMVPDTQSHPSIAGLERCEALVAGFDGPAAIVWGDRDPVLGRARSRTERLLPQAEVTRTSAGHFLQEEVPGEIAAAVRSVASAVEERPTG